MLYKFLKETYGENEPIFVSEIQYANMSINSIRQQIKRLTDEGKIKRYDTGIYFIPKKSVFKSGSQISRDKVLKQKYLLNKGKRCGYVSGIMFANQLGLTTQVPANCELVTNKASNDVRKVKLASAVITLRKPRIQVTEENYRILQLLDLFKDIDYYAEIGKEEIKGKIINYMNKHNIRFSEMNAYFKYYPDRIFKNMFEIGVLQGVSA